MGRPSLSINDYRRLAERKGLTFCSERAPRYTTNSVTWKCLRCGRITSRSYANVRRNAGCRCSHQVASPNKYQVLANRLGIKWTGTLPQNTKSPTQWYSPEQNVTFTATYAQLAYGRIPARFADLVGVIYVEETAS